MYKIGEFSKITNLTIKALRYYDEEDILKPSAYQENGYRLYSEKDIKRAELIVFLRELDFSIKEIKDVLMNYTAEEDMFYFLQEKKEFIKANMQKQKQLIRKIDEKIYLTDKEEETEIQFLVEEKELEEIMVISTRFKGRYEEVGKYISDIYKEAKGNATIPSFNLYYDEGYTQEADIELCVPLKKAISSPLYEVKKLPKTKVISTMLYGSYDNFKYAYKAIFDYANEHKLKVKSPSALIYHKGPGMIFRGNPRNYITQIVVPMVEDEEA